MIYQFENKSILFILIFFVFSCWINNGALAQCNPPPIFNPDLDRSSTCSGCAPNGWTEYNGTPDVGNINNGYCESDWINTCGTYAPGSTNDKIGRFRNETSSCSDLTEEGISQMITGLNPGQTYYLCFWAVNTGRGCDNSGSPQDIYLQASMGGITNSVLIPFTGNGWAIYSIPVTPSSSIAELIFVMPGANSGLGRGVIIFDQVTLECNPPDGPCPSDLIGDPCDAGSGAGSGIYDVNCNCINSTDSDGDGIYDSVDLDDDNDGILDSDECTGNTQTLWTSGFEAGDPQPNDCAGTNGVPVGSTPDYFSGSIYGVFPISGNGAVALHPGQQPSLGLDGDDIYEVFSIPLGTVLQAGDALEVSYAINSQSGNISSWSEVPGNQPSGDGFFEVYGATANCRFDELLFTTSAVTTDGATISESRSVMINNPNITHLTLVPLGVSPTDFPFLIIDDIIIASKDCSDDYDNDGIPNHLDLDSDNDGCPDFIEGGGSFTFTDQQIALGILSDGNGGEVNTNLGNNVNTNPSSNRYGLPIIAGTGQSLGTSQSENDQSDACNCSITCNIIDAIKETCANAGDGRFTVTASSTDPSITNFQYSIDNGLSFVSNPNFTGLLAENYTVITRAVGSIDNCALCEISLECVNQTEQFSDQTFTGNANSQSSGGDDPQHLSGTIETAGTPINGNSTSGNSTLINSTNTSVTLIFDDILPVGGIVTISMADNNGSGNVTISDGNPAGDIIFSGGTQDILQHTPFTITQPTNTINITRNAGGTWVDGASYDFTATISLGFTCDECEEQDCAPISMPKVIVNGGD